MENNKNLINQIDELGKELGWYHCIDLGNGISTKTKSFGGEPVNYPVPKWNILRPHIPEDLQGQSVIDIGSNAGFFCIEAKRRKAGYVLGIDEREDFIKQARFVADVLNMDIEYRQENVYNIPKMNLKFDIVFALGLIYHCKHPLMAAEIIASICNNFAVIESQLIKEFFFWKNPIHLLNKTLYLPWRNRSPFWQFVYTGYQSGMNIGLNEEDFNWWFPNIEALSILFKSVGFKKIKIINNKTRGSIICYK